MRRRNVLKVHLGGSGGCLLAVGLVLLRSVGLLISLVWAVDGDLHGNLASLDFLAVHLRNGLLLELLRGKGDEAEATALAGLATSLELLDHEAGDGAERNLGRRGLVVVEKFLELSNG